MDIRQTLTDVGSGQGWDDESQIFHLCAFLDELSKDAENFQIKGFPEIPIDIRQSFARYLQEAADKENEGVDAVCEKCGDPFKITIMAVMLLCENCKIEAASTPTQSSLGHEWPDNVP